MPTRASHSTPSLPSQLRRVPPCAAATLSLPPYLTTPLASPDHKASSIEIHRRPALLRDAVLSTRLSSTLSLPHYLTTRLAAPGHKTPSIEIHRRPALLYAVALSARLRSTLSLPHRLTHRLSAPGHNTHPTERYPAPAAFPLPSAITKARTVVNMEIPRAN